jgi:hypothetical protein
VLAWDFERFRTDVPIGFDPIHFELQEQLARSSGDLAVVIHSQFTAARGILSTLGVTDDLAETVFALYLFDISARWLSDRQGNAKRWDDVLNALIDAAGWAVASILDASKVSARQVGGAT